MERRRFLQLLVAGAIAAPAVRALQPLVNILAPDSAGALTLDMLRQSFNMCARGTCGPNYIIASRSVYEAYVSLLEPDKRFGRVA